jgi:iron(III)-enterobactin esterase
MSSSESRIYPGIARDPNTFGVPDALDPAKLVVTTSHPAPYTRKVSVYVPKQYAGGSIDVRVYFGLLADWHRRRPE